MSSSPRQATDAAPFQPRPEGEPFPYDAIPDAPITRAPDISADGEGSEQSGLRENAAGGVPDEAAARELQVRAQAREDGQTEARKAFDEQLTRERAGLAEALAQFRRQRAAYFQKVEAEVVQLALAIARRILHREAQLDPLLLAGMVRVALEKIDGATSIRLRVHPQNAAEWRRYLTLRLEPAEVPEIVEDPAQEPDRCTLETSMGTAVIGVEVQLKEIEQGLLDLLAARPGTAS
jgi:flagellar assembly protein FliH